MKRWMMAGAIALGLAAPARAEVSEVTLGQQFGLSFLPMMYMENAKLVEKHAKALGLPEPKVVWAKLAGPSNLNEGLISGAIQFTALGTPSIGLLWDRTRGDVKGLVAICSYPLYLNTKTPGVKSLKDFGPKDKIAIPSVKVSTQAIMLQMQAEKEFGPGEHFKIDGNTVSLSHPDAMTALLSNTEVTAHFASSPFHEVEKKDPRIHTVMTSYEILGGMATAATLITSERFKKANPKTVQAVVNATREAIDYLNADKRRAAELYLKLAGGKNTVEELTEIISDPNWAYTLTPQKIGKTIQFMNRLGTVRTPVKDWKDVFFAEAHDLPGD
ncbi:ABC transporter substrate-binding protein [Enterovirga rhinocerotis]|uniref:NitT/TauT family transport system substrate-binding protein n=1 Tax=Enterovirga rhinocerotis TaxID=1339210 RepID=A0A4R7C6H1_9HYPH|nr:ABC transporter substrate-binding protein [Enterovirga rhinocerotis]TDR93542.1 NitT/TauT family transport system substrate-binding protein [Enterovirga rhinocerotis]